MFNAKTLLALAVLLMFVAVFVLPLVVGVVKILIGLLVVAGLIAAGVAVARMITG